MISKLAILIPVYNEGDSLLHTLESIKEDRNDFTVFIVDDGSTEPISINTSKFPFDIRILRLDANKGIVSALNYGLYTIIESNSYELVARLDCGDSNVKNRFKTQLSVFSNPKINLVGSNVLFFDKDNNYQFNTNVPIEHENILRYKWKKTCFIHPTVMFRLSVIDQIGFYPDRYRHIEDLVYFHKMSQIGRSINISDSLVECEIRKSGISHLNRKEQLSNGLRYRFDNPDYFDLYWYLSILKNLLSRFLSRRIIDKLK
ncbi:glycosyltransferase [Vibrio breoganii]